MLFDQIGARMDQEVEVVKPVVAAKLNLMLEQWPPGERDHGLGLVAQTIP